MIDCDTEEEQQIGLREVRETLKHIAYYAKVRKKILDNMNDI